MGGPLGARARTGTTAVRAPARALHSQVSTFLFLSEARSDPAPFAVAVVAITSRGGGQNFVSSQTVTGYAAIAAASSAASVASRSSALAEAASALSQGAAVTLTDAQGSPVVLSGTAAAASLASSLSVFLTANSPLPTNVGADTESRRRTMSGFRPEGSATPEVAEVSVYGSGSGRKSVVGPVVGVLVGVLILTAGLLFLFMRRRRRTHARKTRSSLFSSLRLHTLTDSLCTQSNRAPDQLPTELHPPSSPASPSPFLPALPFPPQPPPPLPLPPHLSLLRLSLTSISRPLLVTPLAAAGGTTRAPSRASSPTGSRAIVLPLQRTRRKTSSATATTVMPLSSRTRSVAPISSSLPLGLPA